MQDKLWFTPKYLIFYASVFSWETLQLTQNLYTYLFKEQKPNLLRLTQNDFYIGFSIENTISNRKPSPILGVLERSILRNPYGFMPSIKEFSYNKVK